MSDSGCGGGCSAPDSTGVCVDSAIKRVMIMTGMTVREITGVAAREITGIIGRETGGMTVRDRDDEETPGLGCLLAL